MEIRLTLDAPELAAAIFALAESMQGGSWKPNQVTAATEKAPEPVKQPEPVKEAAPAAIKFETVRAKMAQVMAAVGVDKAKTLVADLGFDGLSKVTPDKYPELMEKADAVLAQ